MTGKKTNSTLRTYDKNVNVDYLKSYAKQSKVMGT